MDRIEADDILSGMPLRSRIENDAALAYDKTRSGLTVTTPSGLRFNFLRRAQNTEAGNNFQKVSLGQELQLLMKKEQIGDI